MKKTMSKRDEMVSIDGKKLRAAFTGDKICKYGVALGRGSQYFVRACIRGRINKNMLKNVCILKGLKMEDYIVPDSPKQKQALVPAVVQPVDATALLELIGELEARVRSLEDEMVAMKWRVS